MEYLTVGQIVRTIGLKGEVKIIPSTHFRDSRFKCGNHVFVLNDKNEVIEDLEITRHAKNGDADNLNFKGLDTIESVEHLIRKFICVVKDPSFLDNNTYFYSDLVGMNVKFDNEIHIGTVTKIEEYNKYATLRIKRNNKDVLIPFIKQFIKSVSLEKKEIIVKFIEGLL